MLSVDETYAELPDNMRQRFTLRIENPVTGETELNYSVPMPDVIGKRLTLSYAPATSTDEQTITAYGNLYDTPPYLINLVPQVKLEGQVVAQGQPVGSGGDQIMRFTFEDGFYTEQVENTIFAGEYYAIALDGQNVTREEAFNRSQRLAQINETIDLADPTTLDERLGELLYLSALTFQQNLDAGIREIAPLHQVVDVRDASEMMYFLTVQVDTFFGVPRSMTPVGLTGDLDRDTHLVIPVDGNLDRIKPFITLEGTQSSYLEHSVTEGIYQTDAISAVKAIQLANDQAIPVHTITKQNAPTILPLLQLDAALETEIANAANAGMEVTVSEQNLVVQDWTGVGYMILDPATGAGAYRISGGFGGVGILREGLVADLVQSFLSFWVGTLHAAEYVLQVCYPGEDLTLDNDNDTCFDIILPIEININQCIGDCELYYGIHHPGRAFPLINREAGYNRKTQQNLGENALLTPKVTAAHWQSQEGAVYMRAGRRVLLEVEVLMDHFGADEHNIFTGDPLASGSGYRTTNRNTVVGGAEKSYHPDGVAGDIKLEDKADPNNVIQQCEVLFKANFDVGQNGEVMDEGNPTFVHIATPANYNRDFDGFRKSDGVWYWACP